MANWRNLFANAPTHSLDFFPPELKDGILVVSPPEEVFEEGAADWKHSLVAQFLGKPPNFSLMHRVLSKLWEKKGTLNITLAGPNLYIFQFENEIVCNWILENGPWHIQHNTMILRKWEPNLKPINFDLDRLPIWFHLHKIPLELFNRKGISYIASAIGTPLYMDSVTAARKRLTYAKVCIEVLASIEPPESVKVKLKNGTEIFIPVSIPWKPSVCKSCSLFGHSDQNCLKGKEKTKQVWRQKESTETHANPKEPVKDFAIFADPQEEDTINDPLIIKDVDPPTNKVVNESKDDDDAQFVQVKSRGKAKANELSKSSGLKINSCGLIGMPSGFKSNQKSASKNYNQKFHITSSSNKYNALCEDALDDVSDEEDDLSDIPAAVDNTIWEKIVNNATYVQKNGRVQREAAKGASQVLWDMKTRKNKLIAEAVKKGVVLSPPMKKRK